MTLILGVDPGRNGALAVLNNDTLRVCTHDMPDTLSALHELIAGLPIIKVAAVEKPFYPHGIGTRNVATIAERYGMLLGALQWRSIPAREVRPVEWKRGLNVPSDKSAAREKAGMFFPDDADQWPLAKHDGRAEAALIAWYGKRFLQC